MKTAARGCNISEVWKADQSDRWPFPIPSCISKWLFLRVASFLQNSKIHCVHLWSAASYPLNMLSNAHATYDVFKRYLQKIFTLLLVLKIHKQIITYIGP